MAFPRLVQFTKGSVARKPESLVHDPLEASLAVRYHSDVMPYLVYDTVPNSKQTNGTVCHVLEETYHPV
jgi:hypothetical protein